MFIQGQLKFFVLFSLIIFSTCAPIVLQLEKGRKIPKITSNHDELRFLDQNDNHIQIKYEPDEDFFVTKIELGTPAQIFNVQVDTTTGMTWVPSSNCVGCKTNKTYDSSKSTSFSTTNKTIKIEIRDEDGDVSGKVAMDTVKIGNLTGDGFGFVQVEHYDDDFADYEHGKLGLGFSSPYGRYPYNLIDVLFGSGAIEEKIFAIESINDKTGKLHIGGFPSEIERNSEKYSTCNLTSAEAVDPDFKDSWVCEISHLFFGKNANFTDTREIIDGRAVFDSASSYITLPSSYLQVYKKNYLFDIFKSSCKEVDGETDVKIVCEKNATSIRPKDFKPAGFLIDGYGYQVNGEDLFDVHVDGEVYEFLIRFSKVDDGLFIFGYPFVSQYTLVFNAEENNVGFYGDDKIDFTDEWMAWLRGESKQQKADQFFYMVVGASVLGAILLIIIVFIVVHSIKRRRLEEHGPLINEQSSR
jgi:hypothetical protein